MDISQVPEHTLAETLPNQKTSLFTKIKTLWITLPSSKKLSVGGLAFLSLLVVSTPLILTQSTSLLSHAGISLHTTCVTPPPCVEQGTCPNIANAPGVNWCSAKAANIAQQINPIQQENALPGTTSWIINGNGSDWRLRTIEGYAKAVSVIAGSQIDFAVSTTEATYSATIYRLGYYQGTGARLIKTYTNLSGQSYPIPAANADGKIEANWPTAFSFTPTTLSGMYLVKLTSFSGKSWYIPFVVKDTRSTPLVFVHSAITSEAYNPWGGKSLYADVSGNTSDPVGNRARKVSFNRPYRFDWGGGNLFYQEYNFIRFMEQAGVDATYIADTDIQANPNFYQGYKGIVMAGHNEYWSKQMHDTLESAVAAKVNLAVFGGNDGYWQIRFEPADTGEPNKTIVCYRHDYEDPLKGLNNSELTINPRLDPVNHAEQGLLGVMSSFYYGPAVADQSQAFPLVVSDDTSWIYTGTGLHNGDQVPGLVGGEADMLNTDQAFTPMYPSNIDIVSSSPVQMHPGYPGGTQANSNASIYTASSGAQVFHAGSIFWSYGLDGFILPGSDMSTTIRQPTSAAWIITKNILDVFSGGSLTFQLKTPNMSPVPTPTSTITPKLFAQPKCINTVSSITFSWSPVAGATSYTVDFWGSINGKYNEYQVSNIKSTSITLPNASYPINQVTPKDASATPITMTSGFTQSVKMGGAASVYVSGQPSNYGTTTGFTTAQCTPNAISIPTLPID